MKSLVSLLLAVLAAAQSPGFNAVQLFDISYGGTGCPQGSTSVNISPDGSQITLSYDKFQVYIGPGYSPADKTKSCQVDLNIRYPQGLRYSIMNSTYHGYAVLDTGLRKTFHSNFNITQVTRVAASTQFSIDGGTTGVRQEFTGTVPISDSNVVSSCSSPSTLIIEEKVSLTSTRSGASSDPDDDTDEVPYIHQVYLK